jgi:hypothetical protein
MNTNKSKIKLLATITIMLLFASAMLAVVPAATAVTAASVAPTSGNVGTVVSVSATATNYGATLVAYWNSISDANRLNSTRLTGSTLTRSFDVTIPEAQAGTYGIIVAEELASGGSSNAATGVASFTVQPKITVILAQDTRGQTVTISGTGFSRSTPAPASDPNDVTFTFSNLNLGVPPSPVRPSSVGSFSVTFRVADTAANGPYTITATAANGETDDAVFTVGPVITISPNSGTQGTRATITGRGFAPNTDILPSNIKFANANYGLVVDSTGTITTDSLGRFTTQIVVNKVVNSSSTNNLQTITVYDGSDLGAGEFKITQYGLASVIPDVRAGEPTTSTGIGSLIKVSGNYFVPGTTVNLTLVSSTGTIVAVGSTMTTSSTGAFSGDFIIPGITTGLYKLIATGEYGITAVYDDFGVTILYVGVYSKTSGVEIPITTSVPTGTTVTIKGLGFNIFTTTYRANISIGDQVIRTGLTHTDVMTNGVDIVLGVDGSTLESGTYKITITTNEGLSASTTITVSAVAQVTVTPKTSPRDSQLNITGTNFSPGSIARIDFLNATSGARVASTTANVNSTGGFSVIPAKSIMVPADFALGNYIINVTDSRGVTAETSLTVAKVSINITLGATTYNQGDIATFQMTSNTAPTGQISVYDSSGAWVTILDIKTENWALTASDIYVYQQSNVGGVPQGALLTIASDARTGTWGWNATINDAKEPQTPNGTFTVNAKNTTPTAPPTTAPPVTNPPTTAPPVTNPPTTAPPETNPPTTAPPVTETPEPPKERNWTTIIIIIAVIALIIGIIAVFLFIRMRQNIAN